MQEISAEFVTCHGARRFVEFRGAAGVALNRPGIARYRADARYEAKSCQIRSMTLASIVSTSAFSGAFSEYIDSVTVLQ